MSEQPIVDAPVTDAPATTDTPDAPKPTETVEFWKQKAREQERRAKDNAAAALRLTEVEGSAAEKIAAAEAEISSVPTKVAAELRTHLVALHGIEADDADLFLTANDPALLLKQVERLVGRSTSKTNFVPREGTPTTAKPDRALEAVRGLFGGPS